MPHLKTTAAAALAVLALSGAGPATAAIASSAAAAPDTMVVRLHGLDLRSEIGAQMALNRIVRASDRFCGWYDVRDVARTQAYRACAAGMTEAAVKTLDSPRVTALHGGRSQILLARRGR